MKTLKLMCELGLGNLRLVQRQPCFSALLLRNLHLACLILLDTRHLDLTAKKFKLEDIVLHRVDRRWQLANLVVRPVKRT